MGGGFASVNTLKGSYYPGRDVCPSFDAYAEAITGAILGAGFQDDHLPLLILETGRALVDTAGSLAGKIAASKRLADGRNALVLDFGVNLLFTAFWYDHLISPVEMPASDFSEDTVMYGPLCMNIDCVREHISFPPLQRGDAVVAWPAGAYNMTQWSQFITLRPAVVLIDMQEKPHLIRKRENLEIASKEELLPSHLK